MLEREELLRRLQTDAHVWDHYTRREEYVGGPRDPYGRFSSRTSAYGDIMDPSGSRLLHESGFRPDYPEDHAFGVCLTHDVDWVYSPLSTRGVTAVRRVARNRRVPAPQSIVRALRQGRKWPLCNFEECMRLEEEYGARSSFFFLVQDPGETDYSYEIEDLGPEIGTIVDRGFEVGLHGGLTSYRDLNQLRTRKARLEHVINREVVGYRNHYLCFQTPTTWDLLAAAGFRYDTTFGYHDAVGFRNGMCHPFYPCNPEGTWSPDLLELPLVVMDTTMFTYMGLDLVQAWDLIRTMIEVVERHRGVITILWHSQNLSGDRLRLYLRTLQCCSEKHAWMTSGKELSDWWSRHVVS